jgi:hypothetical protein
VFLSHEIRCSCVNKHRCLSILFAPSLPPNPKTLPHCGAAPPPGHLRPSCVLLSAATVGSITGQILGGVVVAADVPLGTELTTMTMLVVSSYGVGAAKGRWPQRILWLQDAAATPFNLIGSPWGSGGVDERAPAGSGVRSLFVSIPLHEGAWSIYSRHDGGGLLFRQRRSTTCVASFGGSRDLSSSSRWRGVATSESQP